MILTNEQTELTKVQNELLAEYTKDLQTATTNVTNVQTQLTTDTNTKTTFQNLGIDFVKLTSAVVRDNTGRVVTVTFTQTTQSAGKQTPKVWKYSQNLSN
jgi:hypothetical protein